MRSFASDNNSGVHPEILRAIQNANEGHVTAYGADPYTERALAKFKEHFGESAETFFVFNGTGANVLSLKALTESYNAVICASTSHINVDECGAPEKFTGCKLIPVEAPFGKLTVPLIEKHLHGLGDQHHVQPKVISITQATELGTVYSAEETRTVADFAHAHGLYLHMDGARLANAAAALGQSLRALTADAGVDALSFGGTKNGLLGGEAVVFFKPGLAGNFVFIRKQGMQLASKMRFVAAQFEALLSGDLWLRNASHANKMARSLAEKVSTLPQVKLSQRVDANGVFARLPKAAIPTLIEKVFFYVWNEERSEVRWMASFDTTEEDVEAFFKLIRDALS